MRIAKSRCITSLVVILIAIGAITSAARAQNSIGGHIGILKPFVEFADNTTTNLLSQSLVGFPMGITVKPGGAWSFDLELVPFAAYRTIPVGGGLNVSIPSFNFLVHPGVLYNTGFVTIGLRGAWEANGTVGFTPIINKGLFPVGEKATVFGELWLPVRFGVDGRGHGVTSVAVALQFGVGF